MQGAAEQGRPTAAGLSGSALRRRTSKSSKTYVSGPSVSARRRWVAMMPANVQDALGAQVPFPKRLGTAEEYAELACFMIENVYMNAASVRLDGGIRMAPR